ncbi:unnamed protein product [Macrosiphum euphorbiae]|uniref:Vezatin n=1 Tax=Macrosiphum euphorbiae TaxID=13131 RepID=A0AAV0WSU3_9HEMI|nr:unnamed protein product [Macrosiphum euphorbiae]
MEIDDEDVIVDGTDLQKYLNAVGYSEFEVSKRKPVEKLCPTEVLKCSRKITSPNQNQKDFGLCVTLIKIIMESQLIFKEDTLFIKEFIPSKHFKNSPFLTKRKSNLHNSCFHTYDGKNPNAFKYLLMPELRTLLITVLQELINNLVYNVSEVHTFFPLKDLFSNIVYLYKTDCKIDLKNTSFENINKAKYTYFLLQSEFLKQSALCLCPALWTPHSFFHLNRLIETISKIEEIYSNLYSVLYDEYNVYSMFKNNTIEHTKQPVQCTNINSDLKLKIYSIRQFLQNMMVHVRFMEDSFENSSACNIDDINSTLNGLLKDVSVLNELISTLQINILKKNNNQRDKSILTNDSIGVTDHIDIETNEPIKEICEDELFFGVSEEPTENMENIFCNEVIFDKSNNHNLMLELKVALKDKQAEWKQRECKLLEKHPQLNDLSDDDESNETQQVRYINKVRKVALDLPPNESFSMQFPDKSFASEIAMVACKRNTAIECFGDDSDSTTSIDSNDS